MIAIFNKGFEDEVSLTFTSINETLNDQGTSLQFKNENNDIRLSMIDYCDKVLKLKQIKNIYCYIDESDIYGIKFNNYNHINSCQTALFKDPQKGIVKKGTLILDNQKKGG